MSGMFFKYGSYNHPSGQAGVSGFSRSVERGPRGQPVRFTKTLSIQGVVKGSTPAEVDSAVRSLELALAVQNQRAALCFEGGGLTQHVIEPIGSTTGVIAEGPDWGDATQGAEYATSRSFTATFTATYAASGVGLSLYDYSESIVIRGTGGPRYGVREVDLGQPILHVISNQTPVTVQQSGVAIGWSTWPAANPALTGGGAVVQNPDAAVTYETPRNEGSIRTQWVTRWNYLLLATGQQNALRPNL